MFSGHKKRGIKRKREKDISVEDINNNRKSRNLHNNIYETFRLVNCIMNPLWKTVPS